VEFVGGPSGDTGSARGDGSLVAAVAALAEAVAGDVDTGELLTRLVEVAAENLDVDGAGVMVRDAEGLRFAHASGTGVDGLGALQELMQQGPCFDALTFRVDVVVDDLRDPVQTAWPDFVDRALEAGFGSVVAIPLIVRGRVWGTLDLYRRRVQSWQPPELEWIRLLARIAVAYLLIADDRDDARRVQQELAHASTHDALTGLPNRALLFDRLEHALHVGRRHHRTVAVLFIDLDRFKAVNDTFGHAAGDLVLTTVASRMSGVLRQEDTLARLAGDEFVLLCEDLPQSDPGELQTHVDAVLERLHRVLSRPVRVADVDLVVSASIGVALSDDQPDADDLLADADNAMYRVKHRGPGGGEPATPRTVGRGRDRERRQLERQLAVALPRHQLQVHYQPIVDAAGTVHAVEALLRWQHPELGLLPAARFIDLAVESGGIVGIGQWVVERTCAQVSRWRDLLGERAPAVAYVNLSPRELADPGLTSTLAEALDRHGLEPAQLGLELLESSFIDERVLPNLHEQQRRGHPLSVDDFGTGYSSLSRLVELPVRMAKIDKSLVADVGRDPRRRALVDAVVTVANSLQLEVVAEGVETAAQAREVAAAGCHYQQGYLRGRPQPAEVLTAAWSG
jgi:diguanylate cyclase (GGDEF)-like protein